VFTLDEVHNVVIVVNQAVKIGSLESVLTTIKNPLHFERSAPKTLIFDKVEMFIWVNQGGRVDFESIRLRQRLRNVNQSLGQRLYLRLLIFPYPSQVHF
jgi:hypothetical protein